jgi:hypothetical protein
MDPPEAGAPPPAHLRVDSVVTFASTELHSLPSSYPAVGINITDGTSTGLRGVAAISHSIFVARSGGEGVESRSSATPHRIVRTPDNYATHQFAKKHRIAAAVEAERLQREVAEKESRMLANLSSKESKHALLLASADAATS